MAPRTQLLFLFLAQLETLFFAGYARDSIQRYGSGHSFLRLRLLARIHQRHFLSNAIQVIGKRPFPSFPIRVENTLYSQRLILLVCLPLGKISFHIFPTAEFEDSYRTSEYRSTACNSAADKQWEKDITAHIFFVFSSI
jgi:hypothetical protein